MAVVVLGEEAPVEAVVLGEASVVLVEASVVLVEASGALVEASVFR